MGNSITKIHARDLDDNLINKINNSVSTEYVDQQIATITSTGIPKLHVYPLAMATGTEGQTEFEINLDTFDASTDTVLVQRGMLLLNPNGDYVVEDNKVILSEGVSEGQSIGIWVWKNVPLGEDGSVSGKVIADGSLPLSALEEMPTARDVGAMRVYVKLEELGLIDTDIIADDFDTSIGIIIDNMSTGSMLNIASDNYPNLRSMVYSKLNPETNHTFNTGSNTHNFKIIITKWGSNNKITEIRVFVDQAAGRTRIFTCLYDISSGIVNISKFAETFNDVGFLPLDGSVPISGRLRIEYSGKAVSSIIEYNGATHLRNTDKTSDTPKYCEIAFSQTYTPKYNVVDDSNVKQYNIFGEHNKPSGYYTGNGDVTERVIDIGGIGNFLRVRCSWGFGIVHYNGAVFFCTGLNNKQTILLDSNSINFRVGKLNIMENVCFNVNGAIYDYEL